MVAARWTEHAEDITDKSDTWSDYLTLQQLANKLQLEHGTITDALTRSFSRDDPRAAINPPAARIGGRVGATPMWRPEQAREYVKLAKARQARQTRERRKPTLPTINPAVAAERGLVTMAELCEQTGHPKSTVSKWIRQYSEESAHPFPPVVGFALRVPPAQMGAPRPLRDLTAVRAWIEAYRERKATERGGYAA